LQAHYTYINLTPNIRYAMMFLVLGSLGVAFVATRMIMSKTLLACFTWLIFIYNLAFLILFPPMDMVKNDRLLLDWTLFLKYPNLFYLFLLILVILGVLILSIMKINKNKRIWGSLVSIFFLAFGVFSFGLWQKTVPIREELKNYFFTFWYKEQEPQFSYKLAKASDWFEKNTVAAKIAYSGFNFHYHFFGRKWQNEVSYVNINECLNCQYVDFKNNPLSIRRDPNYGNWLANLKAEQKDYLVLAPSATPDVEVYEFGWAKKNPKNFKEVWREGEVYIYKINW